MARSKETPHTAATETDDVQQSLELLDRVLLEFEDSTSVTSRDNEGAAAEPPPPPEEAARLISALMPRGSPRGSPGHSLRRSPPEPGGSSPSPSQATAGTQTTLPKARHIGSKKLSSRFGSLPFDLSSHAAPQPTPPWLVVLEGRAQKEGAKEGGSGGGAVGDRKNLLHLPLHNPLTTSLSHEPHSCSSGSEIGDEEEQQFSDDSLEGQVSSSDREADFRDVGSSTSHECGAEEGEGESRQRGSIAWDIPLDWDLDQAASCEASASKKRRKDDPVKGVSRSQPQTPSCPPPPLPSSISSGGGGTYVIRDKKKRPALEDTFRYCPVIPSSATFSSGLSQAWQYKQQQKEQMKKGTSLPILQTFKQPSHYSKPRNVPDDVENHVSGSPTDIDGSTFEKHEKEPCQTESSNDMINNIDRRRNGDLSITENEVLENKRNSPREEILEVETQTLVANGEENHKKEAIIDSPQNEMNNVNNQNCVSNGIENVDNNKSSPQHMENEVESQICVVDVNSEEKCNTDNENSSREHGSINTEGDIKTMCNNIESKPYEVCETTSHTASNNTGEELIEAAAISVNKDSNVDIILNESEKQSDISEMSFKIMRPKKNRPHSMPPSEGNIIVFKSTVQLDSSDKNKHKNMRPLSMPPKDEERIIFPICETRINTNIPELACVKEPEPDYLNVEETTQVNTQGKTRPQSVYIAKSDENKVEIKSRPISCSNLHFNSTGSEHKISPPSYDAAPPPPLPLITQPVDSIDVQNSDKQSQPLPYDSTDVPDSPCIDLKPSSVPSSTQISSSPSSSSPPLPVNTEENYNSMDLEMPPPPSSNELQTDVNLPEFLSELDDKVEVPLSNYGTVNSLVQTDISVLGKRHKMTFDSPSEEQVVPSLSFRTNMLLTPDDPPLNKSIVSITLDEEDVPPSSGGISILKNRLEENKVMEPGLLKYDTEPVCNKIHVVGDKILCKNKEDSVLITTVTIETKNDELIKKEDISNNFSPIKRPTDLFSNNKPTPLETKLSRDNNRRKSHGSTLEMTSRVAENRRSAPESSFLFPQGHYTIPLSFAVTNKPPGRNHHHAANVDSRVTEQVQVVADTCNAATSTDPEKPIEVPVETPPVPVSTEPTYKSVNKKKPTANGVAKRHREAQPPPPPPHQNLSPPEDEYAEPRAIPDFPSTSRKHQHSARPTRPRNLVTHKESSQQPPPPPPHQTGPFEAEKPLPPTPLTPVQNTKLSILDDFDAHPLPPSPHSPKPLRPLPTSATFPVPPSPSSLHKISKSQHVSSSPHTGRRRLTPPSPLLPRPPSPPRGSRPHPVPASPMQLRALELGADAGRAGPRRPLPSPPDDYGFVTREPGTTGLGSLKTRSVDAGLGRGLREQLQTSISQAREVGADRRTLPTELSGATPRRHLGPQYNTGLRQGKKKGRAPTVPPHASLPETPVFARGCDIPRAPYRPPAVGIPVLRSSLSEEGDRLVLCGPARGWYPKQRHNKPTRSTENLDQVSSLWGEPRKPQTLPPNLNPPKFFHRSPREALRRVTSLLIRRGSSSKEPRAAKEVVSPNGASGSQHCETPQRQKRSFFRNFWKKSKHYSLEQ